MKHMFAAFIAAAAIVSGAIPASEANAAGTTVNTNECLKVLRRDGNYLVCPNGDGTHTVYKLKSLLRR